MVSFGQNVGNAGTYCVFPRYHLIQLWPLTVINGIVTPATKVIYHYNPSYNC